MFETQYAALTYARLVARKEHGDLYLHDRYGQILHSDSYRADPAEPLRRK